jgi:hypothetical protein
VNEVVVYGAGDFFVTLHPLLEENDIHIIDVLDQHADVESYTRLGHLVKGITEYRFSDQQSIVIASSSHAEEMIKLVTDKNDRVQVYSILD